MILDMFRLDDKVAVITGGGRGRRSNRIGFRPGRREMPSSTTNIIRA